MVILDDSVLEVIETAKTTTMLHWNLRNQWEMCGHLKTIVLSDSHLCGRFTNACGLVAVCFV